MPVLRLAYFSVKTLLVVFFDLSAISYPYGVERVYIFPFVARNFVRNSENFGQFQVVFENLLHHLLVERTADRVIILLIFMFVHPFARQNLLGRSRKRTEFSAVVIS